MTLVVSTRMQQFSVSRAYLYAPVQQPTFVSICDEDFEEGGSFLDFSRWSEFKTRIQRHVDRDGLLRARRWGNIVNGILLSVTGPVALAASAFGMRLSHIVLSLYVTAFGGLLTGIELGLSPVAPWVSENLIFLTTGRGRTALLAFAGNLIW